MAETATVVTTSKRCHECGIGLAPEIRFGGQLVCSADLEIIRPNGAVCPRCAQRASLADAPAPALDGRE